MVMKTVGRRIREVREQIGMTQGELAKRVHVSRASVQSWESGQTYPSIDNCVSLANIFHLSVDYLIARSPHKEIRVDQYSESEKRLLFELLEQFDRNAEKRKRRRFARRS